MNIAIVERFQNLTILEIDNIWKTRFLCYCHLCNKTKALRESKIKWGNCGCGYSGIEIKGLSEISKPRTRNKNIMEKYLKSIKTTAKSRQIDYRLNPIYCQKLLETQNYLCKISGIKISLEAKTASLDRIDSLKPYEEGNMQWVHKNVNTMKWNFSQAKFLDWILRIYNNNFEK